MAPEAKTCIMWGGGRPGRWLRQGLCEPVGFRKGQEGFGTVRDCDETGRQVTHEGKSGRGARVSQW